jgi:hypothetical protein
MIQRFGFTAALAVLFWCTAVLRFITVSGGFTNDQFLHLAGAQQVLLGEWPTRDFLDAGMPLMYAVSAVAQLALGRTLFAEAVLVASAFGLAAVCTALTVRELTGSRWLALVASVFEVVAGTRAYGYPKVLTYAVGFLLLQRYISRPSTGRLAALAVAIVAAFLFRHDHGIYLAAACAIGVFVAEPSAISGLRRLGLFAGMGTALAAPYLIYVQVYGGLWAYLQKGLEFRTREFARAGYEWPALFSGPQVDLQAALLYLYWLFPVAALLVLLALARRPGWRTPMARVVPIAAVAILINIAFTRPPYEARLPDAIAPAVMLGAWLAWSAWQAPVRWGARAVAVAAGALFWMSLTSTRTIDQFERSGVLTALADFPRSIRETRAKLEAPHDQEMLPSAAEALIPFYDYAGRCMAPTARVLVVGIIPEAVFFTRRGFAGGQSILVAGYYDDESYQRGTLAKLATEAVPFVIIHGPDNENFDTSFPLVAGHVRARYAPLATLGDGDPAGIAHVLIERSLAADRRDAETGWPCPLTPGAPGSRR